MKTVEEMMAEKVDLGKLRPVGSYPDLNEKAARELSVEIEHEKNPDYISISWESQQEAQDFFNEHGFIETLERLTAMRKKRGYYDE